MTSIEIVGLDENNDLGYLSRMSPEQCRAARAWLGLSQDGLASAACVSNSTVRDFEAGRRAPIQATLAAMKAALETRGIAFFDDEKTCGLSFSKIKN
jgi:DNA-binding transcriptional regulator YiaG